VPLTFTYVRPLPPEVHGAKLGFGIAKLGVVCIYPYPNKLAIVCRGIPKIGVESLMVVRL
jgi:hypothetical protein